MVRYTDGQQIGKKRFDGYLYAARHAMNARPLNQIVKKYQFSWHTLVNSGRGGKRKIRAARCARYDRCELHFEKGTEETPSGSDGK